MSTIRVVRDRRFKYVTLMRSMFEDPNLSLQAKGLIGFFMSQEKEKEESGTYAVSLDHIEDKESINHIINECAEHGYAWVDDDHNGEMIISSSKEEIEELKTFFGENTTIASDD